MGRLTRPRPSSVGFIEKRSLRSCSRRCRGRVRGAPMPPESAARCEGHYRLTVAPRFQLRRTFVGRIDRNGGVERRGDCLYPRDDWRSLKPEELSALVGEGAGPGALLPSTQLGLLEIPERLRGAWWREAEKSTGSEGFEGVFSALVEFLRFKRLPLPERVHLEVAVNAPN